MMTLSLLAIWVLFVLLVPKRGVASIAERLGATARADRQYVFGPPPQVGKSFASSALGEAIRLIEVGTPIYMSCLWAEARGRRLRLATPAANPPALPPAPKAHPPARRVYRMPPIEWTREWETSLQRRTNEANHTTASVASAAAT